MTTAQALRVKFVKGATSVPTVKVDDFAGRADEHWYQVDLVNPTDSDLVMVVGLAQHKSKKVFQTRFRWHQTALILDGQMTVQDMDTGAVYRARPGDLYYWAPGLRVTMGGVFLAYYVRTPAVWRWIRTPEGKKKALELFQIENEILYSGSPPDEVRTDLVQAAKAPPPLIKLVKGATSAKTVEVNDLTQMSMDRWKQVDVINPSDTNTVVVSGIAEHPTEDMNKQVTYFYYHQAALILDGQMTTYDMSNGNVYRARQGDLMYWGPGHRHRIGGVFKAFFVKTPVPMRWVRNPDGKKRVLDMRVLEGESLYPASPPDEISKGTIREA